jgi:hypothetical protein
MTFNNNKFGILTNWRRALFLRRADTSDRKTLEFYPVELDEPNPPISMLKAWVGMVLLAEDDWFYASPTPSSAPPGRNFGTSKPAWEQRNKAAEEYTMHPVGGKYQCIPLDFRLCRFDLSSARNRAIGCVVNGRLISVSVGKSDLRVVFKVVDKLRYPDAASTLEDEASAYASLEDLQGKVIPKLYGFYEVWGILRLLALEPVGDAISQDGYIDQTLLGKMQRARCSAFTTLGLSMAILHVVIFVGRKRDGILLVDLERCHAANDSSEIEDEMAEVERL